MKAYSTDLRERVAAACQQGGRTIGEVAAQFSVSDSFVRKLAVPPAHERFARCPAPAQRTGPVPGRGGPGATAGLPAPTARRVVALQALFIETVQQEDSTRFIFVDETSTNPTYYRRYARAEGGRRAAQASPLHGRPNVTLVALRQQAALRAEAPQ